MGKALFTTNVTIAFARTFASSGLMSTASVLVLASFMICVTAAAAEAQQIGSVREGSRLAYSECAQCHRVDKKGYSLNPPAPAFDDIANVSGMTSTALTVALQTSHRSMPNMIIKGRDAQHIIAYILSLKRK
jgi:mono/diheme cytochrome c family protein